MKRAVWLVLLVLEACMVGNGESAKRMAARRSTPADTSGGGPSVAAVPPAVLLAESEYWLGFPMVIALTVTNPSPTRTWYDLPECRLLEAPGPIEIFFTAPGGQRVELPSASLRMGEGPDIGFTLGPGDAHTMLFDMSEMEPALTEGEWQLAASYKTKRGLSKAPPVTIRIVAPSKEDALGAARLRTTNRDSAASWSRFLDDGLPDLSEVDLSPAAWRQLAFHEVAHRALYAPGSLATIDPALFVGFEEGPLAGESALIRLELWKARGDARAAKVREKILARWPGLAWRVLEIDEGRGWLSELRKSVRGE